MALQRFIPACAGNTRSPGRCPVGTTVHPRVRGEYAYESPASVSLRGSSPRARGIHIELFPISSPSRFIPACAGNTIRHLGRAPAAPVHPRVRGEYAVDQDGGEVGTGSSPRARGIRSYGLRLGALGRFIPACAGNTGRGRRGGPGRAVHPRVRGEYCSTASSRTRAAGSSPRARGIRQALL